MARRSGVVAMDGFSGFKTATTEELPDATTVMDPLHVVRLVGDALDRCRRRVQQSIHGHRAAARTTRSTEPAEPCTPAQNLLIDKQKDRLAALFDGDNYVQARRYEGSTNARSPPTANPTASRAAN